MFDAKRLLGQVIASQLGGRSGSGGFGGAGLGGGSGALVGGLASVLLGSKKGRRLGGSAAKMGGLAMVGSLAFKAFQAWQAQQQAGGPGGRPASGGIFGQPSSPVPSGDGSWSGGGAWAASAGGFAPGACPVHGAEALPGTPFHPTTKASSRISRGACCGP